VKIADAPYTVGAIVQANYGVRRELRIAGAPVGKHLTNDLVWSKPDQTPQDQGSIIIVVATDAPLLPHQLQRLARRAALGLARNGSYAGNGSGDIFIAFSTANEAANQVETATVRALGNEQMDPLFIATVQAVEESIVNAMAAAETMTGRNGAKAVAIDHEALQKVLKEYGRLESNKEPQKTAKKEKRS
jgi:D-aminopeptidase